MEQTLRNGLSEAEMEVEIGQMQAQTRLMLEEIKAERKRGDSAWREAQQHSATNARMLSELGEILLTLNPCSSQTNYQVSGVTSSQD